MKSLQMDVETVTLISSQLTDQDRAAVSYDGGSLVGPDSVIDRVAAFDMVALQKASLIAYANSRQWTIATGGHVVTVNGSPVGFATDPTSFALITGKAARLQQPDAPTSVNWQTGPTTFVSMSAADFITAATTIADWMQSTFDVLLQTVIPAIEAGTFTTRAHVDAAIIV